jgi:hypothetical protein
MLIRWNGYAGWSGSTLFTHVIKAYIWWKQIWAAKLPLMYWTVQLLLRLPSHWVCTDWAVPHSPDSEVSQYTPYWWYWTARTTCHWAPSSWRSSSCRLNLETASGESSICCYPCPRSCNIQHNIDFINIHKLAKSHSACLCWISWM